MLQGALTGARQSEGPKKEIYDYFDRMAKSELAPDVPQDMFVAIQKR